ncbi:MAG: outer membrane protein assembly factor BamA [Proteobacteria bacterium]|nr:outer membrane protein assembly factor BamA [Pseudomonadota bacterium]MBU1059742.1 outer membrane protein assembly factor BamA [Pseudomonadota bacterium]
MNYSINPNNPSRIQGGYQLSCLLLALIVSLNLFFPGLGRAVEQNTSFLPLKINSPTKQAEITLQADQALASVLLPLTFSEMKRVEAARLLDYTGPWPPAPDQLQKVTAATGLDYVAVGSLTVIGNQISVDYKVFDLLAPKTPQYFYRKGESLENLTTTLSEVIREIIASTGRDFIIASIGPNGNKRIDSGAISRKINTKAGDFYNQTALREDLKAIYKMGYFENVRIEVEESEKGKIVTFEVTEKPIIKRIEFSGTDAISEDDVKEAVNITPNSIINTTKVNEGSAAIKALYKSKGYYNTMVTAQISYPDEEYASIRYIIEEGEKIFIKEIKFIGNKSFDSDDLSDVIESSEKGWLSWLTESGLMKQEMLMQDVARLGSFYNNQGFLEVKVGDPKVDQDGEWLYITFTIEEGPRYRVGTVTFTGDLLDDQQKLRSFLSIQNEEFINRQILRDDILKITDYYSEHGYAFANIRPNMNKSAAGARVDISIDIDKGDLVYIQRIMIKGNTRTRDNVIRRELKIAEGGIFDSKALRTSTQRLQRLEFFEEVNIVPAPAMDPTKMDVTVNIKEKSTGQFSIGAGYSSVDSFMLMGEISENNFLGRGDKLSFVANLSGTSNRFNLGYTNPHLRDSKLSVGADLFNWFREYDDYDKDSKGGALRFGYPLWEKWHGYGSYSYTDTTLSDVSEYASQIIIDSMDINVTSAVKVGLVRDSRDRITNPSEGSQNSVSVKYAGGPFAGDAEFTKLEAFSSWYFPLPWTTVFHFKLAGGQVWENETGKLPVYERFYLGGINTIRGFEYAMVSPIDSETGDRIGGDKMWYSNIEYIFPILTEAGIQGVVFLDAGKVFADDEDWSGDSYNKAAGLEMRWMSPMGPLRLVWGYNLDPSDDEDQSVWDFSIGGSF